jgi:uncharacterized protein with NRDE domain
MCLIAVRWQPEAPEPLLLLGNRDEFYDRPAAPLAWWDDCGILAGRDLRAGGTWLGVTRQGRCAALTNFRQPATSRPDAPSRGALPVRALASSEPAAAFLEALRPEAAQYNPFNLLLYDGRELLGYQSRNDQILHLAPGLHLLSNGDFDAPWPKAEALRAALAEAPEEDTALLKLLEDGRGFEDGRLPRTGVPLAWERALAPIFIRTAAYGTRAATLVRLGRSEVRVVEQGFDQAGPLARTRIAFFRQDPQGA